MPDSNDAIKLSIDDRIATLILQRPPVNAINDVFIEDLNKSLDQIESQSELSVLHIKSELGVFSAGADLGLMRECLATTEGRDSMLEITRELQRVYLRIENLDIVSVAEIGGAAMGGGLELALACDLRVASEQAKLGLPEASLGLLPAAGGTQRMSKICGEAVARRLILGAEIVDGIEAHRLGLVHWVVASEKLARWSAELVKRIGSIPAEALASCKRCLAAAADDRVDGYELELTETRRLHDAEETQRRVEAFLIKSSKHVAG